MLSDNLSPNTLRPIFSHALSLKLETIKLDAFIQSYSAGQTLPGKVIQVLPEQKAVVELQGEKLLLQFPRPVNPNQNITVRIEQIHPSPILKLTELSSTIHSKNIVPDQLAKASLPLNSQQSDKTSIQNRSVDSHSGTPAKNTNAVPGTKNSQTAPDTKVTGPLTNTDLNRLGIEVGQKTKAEVLSVVNRETVQVRLNGNQITLIHSASQKLQPNDSVYIQVKSTPSGKFTLEVEPIAVPSSNVQSSVGLSFLKNYLPARQPLSQVFASLKEVFLDSQATQLNKVNIEPGQLKQLQVNLQKIVSGELKVPEADQLKEIIERSGFNYEAKVKDYVLKAGSSNKNVLFENDLKGQLMRLVRQLEQIPTGAPDSAASEKFIGKLIMQVNHAVSNIELQQLTHHFSKEEQLPLLLQLPENLLGEEDRFKIYILPDQEGGGRQESDSHSRIFNLVFLLNLSALGDLKIDTKIANDEISIHIAGSNSDVIKYIQAHLQELEDSFQEEGFSINVTSRYQSKVSMEVPDSLGQLLVDTPLHMVDLKT